MGTEGYSFLPVLRVQDVSDTRYSVRSRNFTHGLLGKLLLSVTAYNLNKTLIDVTN